MRLLAALAGSTIALPASDLFNLRPPCQIGGNFGGTAGIQAMLLQCRGLVAQGAGQKFEIGVLSALPSAWPKGSVTGLRARGGFAIDMARDGGKLTSITIHLAGGRNTTVRYGSSAAGIELKPAMTVKLNFEH